MSLYVPLSKGTPPGITLVSTSVTPPPLGIIGVGVIGGVLAWRLPAMVFDLLGL